MIEALDLRPYQLEALDKTRAKIASGKRRLCLVSPTGSGKTIISVAMIESAVKRGNRVLFLAHRRELIGQTYDKLKKYGIASGVLMGTDRRRDDYLSVQVASVPTLARRLDKLPPAQLVIVDESHHAVSESYKSVIAGYPGAVIIGLTATPWRADKAGLADIYEDSVLVATYAELMRGGALVYYDAFAYDHPDLHDVGVMAGDYNQKDLGLACNTGVLVGSVVREYETHAMGRRGVVFAVNVEHSQNLISEFKSRNIPAAHIDCKTPKTERDRAIVAFNAGDILVLSSVGIFTEGWDAPAAEVAMLARPTKSLGLYMQMVGRILRPYPGKVKALVHCHSGNVMRHGFVEDERDYGLTSTPARTIAIHTCPMCHQIFGAIRDDGTCPKCGGLIAPPKQERDEEERRQKEQLEGERIAAEEIKRRREEALAAASWPEKAAEYLRLQKIQQAKGYKWEWIHVRFKAVFGHWPKFSSADLGSVEPAKIPFSRKFK